MSSCNVQSVRRERKREHSEESEGGSRKVRRVYDSSGPPPQDFRKISVYLRSDDILVDNSQVYLRKAHIDGQPYDNDDHYLDVQFRLLREDLVRPLRNGIHQFRLLGNDRRTKLDLYVYRDVRLICTQLRKQDGEILTYAAHLGPKDCGRRMHRRFMFGSLVCLSSDAFQQQFLFATVIDRDALEGNKKHQPEKGQQNIRSGTIELKFLGMDRPDMNVTYFLVESPVFYESHRHVLSALKNFKPGDAVPFSRHFVRMERDPEIPRYQRDGRMFNFASLLVNPPRHGVTQCTTTQLSTHFTAADFGMDDSQFEAFAYALRSELAIVQGPPGTGKTHLGLKIVRLLFANEQLWAQPQQQEKDEKKPIATHQHVRYPILVVCYTNHALDQFLEGIDGFLRGGIVRVGRQCKSAKLQKYTLEKLRQRQMDKQFFHSQSDVELMRGAKVIGMTTTGAARLQTTLRLIKPRIVVVEEAAEVYEQHILTSLNEFCEHLIMIGDHQQLRPSPEDYRLGKDYHLEISLFERLVTNGFQFRRLSNQHRMRPEISGTLMPHFYPNLQDHPSVREYPAVRGMEKNLFFLDHSHPEDRKQGTSHSNEFEAMFAVRFAKYLSHQGYEGSKITILCTYSDQLFLIRNLMQQMMPAEPILKDAKGEEDGRSSNNRIRVENVDNYQGEECDIIILSLVRSNNAQKKIGFLDIPNRVCVAMSRAKRGFYVLGNFDFLAECCSKSRESPTLWTDIRQSAIDGGFLGKALPISCQIHGERQEICWAQDFDRKASNGGCSRPCKTRMDCGHTCRKLCHTDDPRHKKIRCMERPCLQHWSMRSRYGKSEMSRVQRGHRRGTWRRTN